MEMEQLEPRVKPLAFKVRAFSRESSPAQKAAHVLEPDLRSHWSAGTNTKEWILLELENVHRNASPHSDLVNSSLLSQTLLLVALQDLNLPCATLTTSQEPCLLSHIRIYNKSVLEWEITVGLRYKPETFVKARPRCEAPRRDMIYPMNYTACRFIRISCLRGNPIAIFFIQLIGVTVKGLEPEFQPVVNYLLPHIMSHKQDAHDMHLQLLQDIADRLLVFLPNLEADLTNFTEATESSIQFLAMLAGPFYPILQVVKERGTLSNVPDSEAFRANQASSLTVSSNFEVQPRKARSPALSFQPGCSSMAFRPDIVFMLLRKAYKDPHLGRVCRLASRALLKLSECTSSDEGPEPVADLTTSVSVDSIKAEGPSQLLLNDYSSLFGEEFRIPDDLSDEAFLNLLDIGLVEEGLLHILYACASQPSLCLKLAESIGSFSSLLPLVQALLPAFRPPFGVPPDQVNDSFSHWNHPLVQRALSQMVALSSSPVYRPLLHACAGYLSSFSVSQVKAACVLIDLCCGVLAPWLPVVTAKVDLAVELCEELLGIIQFDPLGIPQSIARSRAALKYVILALSGHMDDILLKYKKVKHKVLFLLEMLEPFLEPAMVAVKNTIAFGDVSTMFMGKEEDTCAIALTIIHTAAQKPAVLPSLENEWRRGSVAPSVILSVLGPNMPLPPEIDLCKFSFSKVKEEVSPSASLHNVAHGSSAKSSNLDESDGNVDPSEACMKVDAYEDVSNLFAPVELKNITLRGATGNFNENKEGGGGLDAHHGMDVKNMNKKMTDLSIDCLNLQADYLQLVNFQDCESRASEFQRLAMDLHSQSEISPEGHDAAIDALLLAAECYINPFFTMGYKSVAKHLIHSNHTGARAQQNNEFMDLKNICQKKPNVLETIADLERKRDKTVLEILIRAAKLDQEYQQNLHKDVNHMYNMEECSPSYQISELDLQFADSVTLVRKNQVLLWHFVMRYLKKDQSSVHEILLQTLLFLLQSATELFCPPECVIDAILQSAEHLNEMLASFYYQLKEGNMQLITEKLHGARRRWMLLQKLAIASSGVDGEIDSAVTSKSGFQYRNLVPPSSWFQRIPVFSECSFPLVRFVGWMSVSYLAKNFMNDGMFLSQDTSHATLLLSFFADEFAQTDCTTGQSIEALNVGLNGVHQHPDSDKSIGASDIAKDLHSFHILYPELYKFFPKMKKQFATFGEAILQAVSLQLKSFPSTAVPDVLCWFSDMCLSPFLEKGKRHSSSSTVTGLSRGISATNIKAVILYVLEAIVSEHLESMLPEMPRVSQILLSLCRSSYCDVTFLGDVLALLKPLISYALEKYAEGEQKLIDNISYYDLETLFFEDFFSYIQCKKEHLWTTEDKCNNGQLVIFILGALFSNMSLGRKKQTLQALSSWTGFTRSESTTCFYDYLLAFQCVMDSCNILLFHSSEGFDSNGPFPEPQLNIRSTASSSEHKFLQPECFDDAPHHFLSTVNAVEAENISGSAVLSNRSVRPLSLSEIEEISTSLEDLIVKLCPTIEACWNLHFKLAKKIAVSMAKCLMLLKFLSQLSQFVTNKDGNTGENIECSLGVYSKSWADAVEWLTEAIMMNQQNHCWQVSSCMLDFAFEMPVTFSFNSVVHICSVIKSFCCLAPRISWRLQTDQWLFSLFMRDVSGHEHLVDLFGAILGHWEPEQRSTALKHLGRIINLDMNIGIPKLSYITRQSAFTADPVVSFKESVISCLVSGTWDRVAAMALSDPSILLRVHAMVLLSGYIPFVGVDQLKSFLVAADTLPGLGKYSSAIQGPFIKLSLGLLANACLHSPLEDISLIPEIVWERLECIATSKTGLSDTERSICNALCKLRTEKDDAREVLKEIVSTKSAVINKNPELKGVRESILQVVASLTSTQVYLDFFSKKSEEEAQELDEAEIELELLHKERAHQDFSSCQREEAHPFSALADNTKDGCRLKQIKDEIHYIEKSKLREEIAVRRQKKLLLRRHRQKHLEEATLREMELLQELDRERANEAEKEVERQRSLEFERAKTRELRYNLDMEKERQAQRDLQRELEQVESGVRTSRRDFSSNPSNRPREKYRERENGRMGAEGSLRPSSRGQDGAAPQTSASTSNLGGSVPTLVLAGSRTFSGQPPAILQPRERPDERGMAYEDTYEGSRDSGDASSVGDPDVLPSLDAGGGFASGARQGRGSKSRQIVERRERDGRREGKWERKQP